MAYSSHFDYLTAVYRIMPSIVVRLAQNVINLASPIPTNQQSSTDGYGGASNVCALSRTRAPVHISTDICRHWNNAMSSNPTSLRRPGIGLGRSSSALGLWQSRSIAGMLRLHGMILVSVAHHLKSPRRKIFSMIS